MEMAAYLMAAVRVEGLSVREVDRAHGVSKTWLYELPARYGREGEARLVPRSRRPKRSPSQSCRWVGGGDRRAAQRAQRTGFRCRSRDARPNGQIRTAPGDEGVDHCGFGLLSLAKYTVARLRISIAVLAVRSSRRSSASSARSSVETPLLRPSSMSACFIQLRRQDSAIPRSSAVSAIGFSGAGRAPRPAGGTRADGVWACGHPSKGRLSPPHVGCPPDRGKLKGPNASSHPRHPRPPGTPSGS